MLTDNAIIIIEGIKVGIEGGRNKLEVVREVVAENQWPLFGATAIGVIAFAAIGLSEDSTGEYTNSLFWVIMIALEFELGVIGHRDAAAELSFIQAGGQERSRRPGMTIPMMSLPFRIYRKLLVMALRFRWTVVLGCILLFRRVRAWVSQGRSELLPAGDSGRNSWWMPSLRPALIFARRKRSRRKSSSSFKNSPGSHTLLRSSAEEVCASLLVYSPEAENRAYVQFLVDVNDPDKISEPDRPHPEATRRKLSERQRHR